MVGETLVVGEAQGVEVQGPAGLALAAVVALPGEALPGEALPDKALQGEALLALEQTRLQKFLLAGGQETLHVRGSSSRPGIPYPRCPWPFYTCRQGRQLGWIQ